LADIASDVFQMLEKRRLVARTEHRLEAYAPLAFRTVERSPIAIPKAIAVHLK
jgi:hypothetical protein